MRVIHTADLHFSAKSDKLEEVITTTDFLLQHIDTMYPPNIAIIAGDTLDEADTPIRVDSEPARAAINFVMRLAQICPTLIVKGTRSHDKESPYLFRHLRSTYPIHVASQVEQIAYCATRGTDKTYFWPLNEALQRGVEILAAFTFLPSPDKSNCLPILGGASIQDTNRLAKEAMNDMLAFLGTNNNQLPDNVPRVLIAHGSITGCEYSSGTQAVGEDLEYSLSDLALTNTDLKCFGHIHKMQSWGNVFYSGSPGRLNLGETEVKGFLIHTLDGRNLVETRFIETPARRFVLTEARWEEGGLDGIMAKAAECESQCSGADVRFRYDIPDECRHQVNRDELRTRFENAGARLVKVEQTIIPTVRIRAQGISQLETLAEKIKRWAETTGITVPPRVYDIAATIEGRDVEELIADAQQMVEKKEILIDKEAA